MTKKKAQTVGLDCSSPGSYRSGRQMMVPLLAEGIFAVRFVPTLAFAAPLKSPRHLPGRLRMADSSIRLGPRPHRPGLRAGWTAQRRLDWARFRSIFFPVQIHHSCLPSHRSPTQRPPRALEQTMFGRQKGQCPGPCGRLRLWNAAESAAMLRPFWAATAGEKGNGTLPFDSVEYR